MNKGVYKTQVKPWSDLILSLLVLVTFGPLIVIIALLILMESGEGVIFKQKRVGKDGKIFYIYKFRTMVKGAHRLQRKYRHLNKAKGPLFKIFNDPRFTKFGKYLSSTGLDELPQVWNVIKGDMSWVGPRPLPIAEEKKLPEPFRSIRKTVKPGVTSSWVVEGAHNLSFKQFIDKDKTYIAEVSLWQDVEILVGTFKMVVCCFIKKLVKKSKD